MFFLLPRLLSVVLAVAAAGCIRQTVERKGRVHTPPIRAVQKWNPLWSLKNADDPIPPGWYRPQHPDRAMAWQLRNPLHNFTHYVVGVTDMDTVRTGRYPTHVFAPDGGWNWAFTRYGCCILPFLSFAGERWFIYAGWRETGNLGGKINRKARTVPPKVVPILGTAPSLPD